MGERRLYEKKLADSSQGRQGSWLRIFNPANQTKTKKLRRGKMKEFLSKEKIYRFGVEVKEFGERMGQKKILGIPALRWCCGPVIISEYLRCFCVEK